MPVIPEDLAEGVTGRHPNRWTAAADWHCPGSSRSRGKSYASEYGHYRADSGNLSVAGPVAYRETDVFPFLNSSVFFWGQPLSTPSEQNSAACHQAGINP